MTTLFGTLLEPRTPSECRITPKTVVRFAEGGKIAEVNRGASPGGDAVGDDGAWILPGFIDAHLHLPQWDRRGLDGLSLFDWLDQVVYPAEARLRDADLAESLAEEFVSGLVACGTTTAAIFASPHRPAMEKIFEVFNRRGFRAVCGLMLNDVNVPAELLVPADRALDDSRALAAKWNGANGGLIRYAFSPRMATCCSERLLRGSAELAAMSNCYIMTHVAESPAEEEAVRERFPEWLDDVELFASLGLLTPRTLLGHGVCMTDALRHRVAEAGTAVVHCPTANLFLESGLMDYVAHRRAGVPIALGSSIAAGHDPFMPHVAVSCLQTAKALKVHAIPRGASPAPAPEEAWWLLTRGAAEALRLDDHTGTIEAGFDADCLVVRPEPWIAQLPAHQQASALLYTIRPDQIEHVFIAGRRVGPERSKI
ncbi:MAG: amidohydrolase family protein [Phycisphaerae bacterium]|nr:amidohydrolase family protein [Phycisphaerae bacterium]